MEVGEVAAEGVTRLEAAAQRILVLAQNEDATRWQWVAPAQAPRPSALPPVGEQRPAPAELLPRGAHVVPAAIRAKGSAERRVVLAHRERRVHGAARLGEGAQLQRVGQRGYTAREKEVAFHCTCTHAVSAPSTGRGVRSHAAWPAVLSPNVTAAAVRAPPGTHGPRPQFPQLRTPSCF